MNQFYEEGVSQIAKILDNLIHLLLLCSRIANLYL